jgi:hypothetical protein
MQRATKPEIIQDKLERMEIGEEISKKDFVKKLYGDDDYFSQRSFDVHLSKAKKLIPNKEFRVVKGNITRVK